MYEAESGRLRYSSAGHNPALLHAGDRLVLYTDGVTEARNPEGEEFGEERLADALLAATMEFAGAAKQHDDITVITAVR
jgi:serine phosphatase RsbU (regulator of sigma subunit)